MNDKLVSVTDAISLLGLSQASIYRLKARGDLKQVKIGSRTFITRESINHVLENGAESFASGRIAPR
jgi:predicted DNA-binding transcriptional regulator AlpA